MFQFDCGKNFQTNTSCLSENSNKKRVVRNEITNNKSRKSRCRRLLLSVDDGYAK